mgnify:CR=1 FL=1
MNIEIRLKALEEHFNIFENKIPYEELVRWFKMFAEKQGSGHTTQQNDFTQEDWTWYNDFVETHGGEDKLFNHR